MDILAALEFADLLGKVWNVLCVVLGLGLVIFFHELGHFAVAKWCDVHVERFSIGFGPILWSRQKGETEYALSAVPFGGYVKMLGQDDMDPAQMADGDIAQNPRSYSNKKVWQRMAIISAGVIMNIITACFFFMLAYGMGVMESPTRVGKVIAGSPAWTSGIRAGDVIETINGDPMDGFSDVTMDIALSRGDLTIAGKRVNGDSFEISVTPDASGTMPQVGMGPDRNLNVIDPLSKKQAVTFPGLPCSQAVPEFLPGDTIVALDGKEITTFAELKDTLARRADQTIEFSLLRSGGEETVKTMVQPMPFRSLGVSMHVGPIVAVQAGSPAEKAGMKVDDKILTVDGRKVGSEIDPLRLPILLAGLASESRSIPVVVRRQQESAGDSDVTLQVHPIDQPGWREAPSAPGEPLTVAALGIAYHVTSRIARVTPGSEADANGLKADQKIVKVEFIKPDREGPADFLGETANSTVELEPEEDADKPDKPINWAFAFWRAQSVPGRHIVLHVRDGDKTSAVKLTKNESEQDWFLPIRGVHTEFLEVERQATSVGNAFSMGFKQTKKNILQIYLTLRALFVGRISPKELRGPLGIAEVGYKVAKQGIPRLMLFLGFLSVNLAVLNFLPIPVLDGGHMVFLIYEAIAGRKPSERVMIAAQYVGLFFILGLMLFVVGIDFTRIFSG